MTDANDLRRMLDELADETPEVPTQEWLAGTRHKVRVRRRARWVGATAATALVLAAAVAVVPQVVDEADSDPPPIEPVPTPEEPPGWDFAEGTEVRRVIASRLNGSGASELEWTLSIKGNPRRTDATLQFCQLPEAATGQGPIRLVSRVDSRRLQVSRCRHWPKYPPVVGRMTTVYSGRSLAAYGVDRSKPFTISMWLERDGQRIDVPGVEFGIAVYWEGWRFPQSGGGAPLGMPWRWADVGVRPDG